jgi:UDP-glucose 4-epimerase
MNNILVTGGCGFIGSNLVDQLVSDGHNVIVIDNLSSTAHDQFYYNKNAIYYNIDITDKDSLNKIFKNHSIDYIFHLAAECRIQNCIKNPTKAFNTNTIGTQNILEMAKIFNIKRVLLSSTSAIYGLNDILPQKETLPADCLNMYSYSKLFSEGLCKLYSTAYGVDSVCFRYFNVYGPRQPVRGSYAPVIGVFSRQKKMGDPMTIVGDGLQTRDYVHVFDIVSANIAAMNINQKLNADIINIGTGVSYSVLDIATQMGGPYVHVSSRQGEARHTLADVSKAKSILNWESKKDLISYIKNEEYKL